MKHLIFTFFLVILCLGQEQSYAQNQTQAAQAAPPSSAQQQEGKTPKETDKEGDENEGNDINPTLVDKNEVGGDEVSVLSASDKIAEKSRFWSMLQTFIGFGTLCLATAATVFAGLAWREAKTGVDVTREAAKAEYRPYATVSDITLHGNPEILTFHRDEHCNLHGKIKVTNFGRSPIYTRTVSGSMAIIPRGVDIPHFTVSMGVSQQEREIAPNATEELTLFMSFDILKEHGIKEASFESFIFQVNTVVKFDDMFSITTPKYRYFRAEHNGIFTPVEEDGNNVFGTFDRMVHALKLTRMDTFLSRDNIHESKLPENQPKQKTLSEFLNSGNRTQNNDSET